MLSNMQDQSAVVSLVANTYRSLVEDLNIAINPKKLLPKIAEGLGQVVDRTDIKLTKQLRPITPEEEFILCADFALTEFRIAGMDKVATKKDKNCLEVKNGAAISLLDSLGSALMQNFLGLMTVTAAKEFGITDGIPLFSFHDGIGYLSLYESVDEESSDSPESEDPFDALRDFGKDLGINMDKVASVFPNRSKYNN